jgi:two-component system chemotaxis response regulator CheB
VNGRDTPDARTPLRVLVAEDSLTVRRRLCETLAAEPGIEVVGEAEDGRQAIERCQALRPDVLTMDMMMPVMTGLAATEYIMAHCPTPILIVSSSINRGELFKTYDALAAGAVDVLEKPRGDEPDDRWERRFIDTVRLVARIRVITHLRARYAAPAPNGVEVMPAASASARCQVIALGASTGGPGALVRVLRDLSPAVRVPVLAVLHINEPFGSAFADWLDAQVPRPVAFARHGQALVELAGRIVLAPPDQHLVLRNGATLLTHGSEVHSCRPSVDVLFESVAAACGPGAVGGLLTGMGRDGASGLLAMRRAGAATVAQDEASCVVYGMPREAALIGAAARILPLAEIGAALSELAQLAKEARP